MYDLSKISGRYRVSTEESWYAEKDRNKDEKVWYMQIKGRYGLIFPYDEETLCIVVYNNYFGKKIAAFLDQEFILGHAKDEHIYKFPVDQLKKVAKLIKPKVRRIISEKEKERLQELSKEFGFKRGAS